MQMHHNKSETMINGVSTVKCCFLKQQEVFFFEKKPEQICCVLHKAVYVRMCTAKRCAINHSSQIPTNENQSKK